MLSLLVFSLILRTVHSNALPKQNISSTVKNETGEAHWYQPLVSQIYGETLQFSLPLWYASSSSNFHLPCYPPSSCSGTVPFAPDQFYCSVHGSFALGTGNPPSKLMREFCRFTATVNEDSCSTCCKIAARHYTTSVDDVSGIMFAFDPNIPSMRTNSLHPSIFREKRALKTTETNAIKSSIKIQNAVNSAGTLPGLIPIDRSTSSPLYSNNIPQCFCCAPIRPIHSF